MARKFEDNQSITETKVTFAGYSDGVIRRYKAEYKEGSTLGETSIVTWTCDVDGIERLISEDAYSSNATANSLCGYRWEICLRGIDGYDSCVGQTWVDSLLDADPVDWDAFKVVTTQ
jgi:hypothetical protein